MKSREKDEMKKLELLAHVKKQFKYRNVPEPDLVSMISHCRFAKYRKNSYVIMQGDDVEYYYIVLSGKVECYILTAQMTKSIITTSHPGDDFSVPALIRNRSMNSRFVMFAECMADCEIGIIPKNIFLNEILPVPSLNNAFLEMMSMIINEYALERAASSAESKIAAYLCYSIENAKTVINGETHVERGISVQKIADILSISRETVHRVLNDFEKAGIIGILKKGYIIHKHEELIALSNNVGCLMGFYGSV
jgi:CRP-like cAMP-binding protein